jgi:hypothetical protein
MARPTTLDRDVSPPPLRKPSSVLKAVHEGASWRDGAQGQTPAAIEAHSVTIVDHLSYFVRHLSAVSRPVATPRITIQDYENLYQRNRHAHGARFVVHQHDHPVAGVHYDLRLQFSELSSVIWAIPYGLPGNPNSKRPYRMAIETRVHSMWVGCR